MVYRKIPEPVRDEETGCLLWQGKVQPNGYPCRAHRRAYIKAKGPVPPGMTIDHVWELGCRYKHCIEPTHLEAVPLVENIRRAQVHRTRKPLASTCRKGHEFTPENTLWRKKKGRTCRACQREYRRAHYERQLTMIEGRE
jgi:hypothetical protein